jgi:beta-N-acetylhexosaminidase
MRDVAALTRVARECLIIGINDCEAVSAELSRCMQAGLGGVLLFDQALPVGASQKNIKSPQQLQALTQALTATNPRGFIAVDHEGGFTRRADTGAVLQREGVTRLQAAAGFAETLSAARVGALYQAADAKPTATSLEAIQTAVDTNAKLVASQGFNLVFGPVVDVHRDSNPIIGQLQRAYSHDVGCIIQCARQQIAAYHAQGVACTLKHFPGHGCSRVDSHLGVSDVSDAWQAMELEPYRALASSCDLIMVGHLQVKQIDATFPASISPRHISVCREFFPGVIVSDDYQMAGLTDFLQVHYDAEISALRAAERERFLLEKTLEHAFNAGVDLLVFANQLKNYSPEHFLSDFNQAIETLLTHSRLAPETLLAAHQRVQALKDKCLA